MEYIDLEGYSYIVLLNDNFGSEVIFIVGVLGSLVLFMLSGIGLVDYFVDFNIVVIFDNFVVGLCMVDNFMNFMWVFIN